MTTSETERSSGSSTQRGVSRVLGKLEKSLAQGDYYEAHMMYRTLYFRYTSQKRYQDCLDLLFDGAQQLIAKDQESSAADLCLLLVDTLEKRGTDHDDNFLWVPRLGTLIRGLGASSVERETLIQRAVKWSISVHGHYGHPVLHKLIANAFWTEGNAESARHHYLLCEDGSLCGRVLMSISESKGFQSEVDLFLVQAVLQQLCLRHRQTAEDTFNEYTRYHPKILKREFPYKEPLLNFLYFLFRVIDMNRVTGYRALRKLYDPSIKRDSSFLKYVSKIGVIYFGETPEHTHIATGGGMAGMFGDIFNRLLHGFDDDDGEEATTQHRHSANNELD